VLTSVAANADQTDPRLDELFVKLRNAETGVAAQLAQQKIWQIWTETDDEAVQSLMAASARALDRRDYAAALRTLGTVVQLAPDYAEGWNRRATARWLAGDYEGALEDIDRVLRLEPRHFGALAGRGMCLRDLGKLEAAVDAFDEALEINPHARGARINREILLQELERSRI
jgi:tetratricopeptide (TPR) repeat protein